MQHKDVSLSPRCPRNPGICFLCLVLSETHTNPPLHIHRYENVETLGQLVNYDMKCQEWTHSTTRWGHPVLVGNRKFPTTNGQKGEKSQKGGRTLDVSTKSTWSKSTNHLSVSQGNSEFYVIRSNFS